MAYTKQTWVDRIVQNPLTFSAVENADGTITLTPAPGTITAAGTPVDASRMNHIEDGIDDADARLAVVETSDYDMLYDGGAATNTALAASIDGYKYITLLQHTTGTQECGITLSTAFIKSNYARTHRAMTFTDPTHYSYADITFVDTTHITVAITNVGITGALHVLGGN